MSPATKYQHRKIAARALLLTGYLVLFTIQFSYRYFDIANFFVYKAHFASIQSAHHQQKLATHTYQDNTKRSERGGGEAADHGAAQGRRLIA